MSKEMTFENMINRVRDEFKLVAYSPKKNKIILIRPVQCILVRKRKPDHYYFDYAEEGAAGLYISNSSLEKGCYEFIGEL